MGFSQRVLLRKKDKTLEMSVEGDFLEMWQGNWYLGEKRYQSSKVPKIFKFLI